MSCSRLWMVPAGPSRHALDDAIERRFGAAYDAAASSADADTTNTSVRWWDAVGAGDDAVLAAVVLLDQLGRHVRRRRGDADGGGPADALA
eukprot:CAMPEP_0194288668 /NCGR_PEP_ID=MMETSP0169-20130528/37320_1 /TAXON_ID=218684 /ORGANISM="Corethron pennatum, Strain L29A3" /LENGTH=90 /DNA_ID=CAMNT_0039035729 /DNA_START=59 /DNA_END=328 /DNA_ORIENTATION=+